MTIQKTTESYKRKWSMEAVRISPNGTDEPLQLLAEEIDKLSSNTQKNEKIGISFRTLKQFNNETIIIDAGAIIQTTNNKLLNGNDLIQLSKEYEQYAKKTFDNDITTEVIYFYYPLDSANKNEEISEDGKLVEYIIPINKNSDISDAIIRVDKTPYLGKNKRNLNPK